MRDVDGMCAAQPLLTSFLAAMLMPAVSDGDRHKQSRLWWVAAAQWHQQLHISVPLGTNQGVLMELNKRLSPCQLTPALTPWGHVPSAPPGAPPVGPGSLVFALLWHSFGA